jgi:formylglycine-generating enzyme required for sulfatase activity
MVLIPGGTPEATDESLAYGAVVLVVGLLIAGRRRSWRGVAVGIASIVGCRGAMSPAGSSDPSNLQAAFCLDTTEVTVEAYSHCVQLGYCSPAGTSGRECNGTRRDRVDHPINCVDWQQSVEFCRSLGKRLPTETEWQWAASGAGKGWKYPWGKATPSSQVCWKTAGTCPVGSFPFGDDAFGVHDLGGNVWEWTETVAQEAPAERVVHGAGWNSKDPRWFATSFRDTEKATMQGAAIGFRCVKAPN